jgi:polyisoprenoid-binding protein YceI
MQEHFNENYLESDKYPTATFQGKVNEDITWNKPGSYDVSATGILNIHGKAVPKTIKGKLQIGENTLRLDSRFEVPLVDHNIKIPKLLFSNIAEKIDVTCQFSYTPYKKK